MDIQYELESFIKAKQNSGALLLTGKWGCGKTYLLKHIAKELNSKDEYLVVIVSLFGLDEIDALHRLVKESVLYAKSFDENGATTQKVISKVKGTVSPLADALSDYSGVAKGLSAALSINWQDLFNVSSEINCRRNKKTISKKLVLIFDDFERSNINIIDLMGALNDYAENKGIKTIIVADEQHISDKDYAEFKEKLISRTVRLSTDYKTVIRSIVTNYNETEQGYCLFLKRQLDLIEELFSESETENLRSLKALFFDFERIFAAWKSTDIPTDLMPKVFYNFGAVLFSIKSGNYEEDPYGNLFADDRIRKTFKHWEGTHSLASIRNWLIDGIWDATDFEDEIRQKYGIPNMSDEQKFLLYDFWSLDHAIITNGMPTAIHNAYAGDLSRNEIFDLLVKINAMKRYNLPFPCEVDYPKIVSGFEKRKKKVLSGIIEEPKLFRFSFKHQLDSSMHSLCDDMEKFENRLTTLSNKKAALEYFASKSTIPGHVLHGLIIGSFDNQLLENFWNKFTGGSNAEKRDVARVMLNLGYKDTVYITPEEMKETIGNFMELQNRLNGYLALHSDCMTIAIINETIKELKILIEEIEKVLSPCAN